MSYTCVFCGKVSHNPNDERQAYCGACHRFERDTTVEDVVASYTEEKGLRLEIADLKSQLTERISQNRVARRRTSLLAAAAVRKAGIDSRFLAGKLGVTRVAVYNWIETVKE